MKIMRSHAALYAEGQKCIAKTVGFIFPNAFVVIMPECQGGL